MLENYIIIALRNLGRRRFYTLINIVGLSIAIAIAVTSWVTIRYTVTANGQHLKKDRIYAISSVRSFNGQTREISSSHTPLTVHMKESIPGIRNSSRFARGNTVLRRDTEVSSEVVYWVDDSFFDIFSFNLLAGDLSHFGEPNSAVIIDEIAERYFGDEDPIGKEILVNPRNDQEYPFTVVAVMKKPALNSSLFFTVVLPYERQRDILGFDIGSWKDWTSAAFIELDEGTDPVRVEEQMQQFVPIANDVNPGYQTTAYVLTPLTELVFKTAKLSGHPYAFQTSLSELIFPVVTSILILFLSSINFINTAIAYAAGRMKEIAVRKVAGSSQRQLILQFMGENLILVLAALILGTMLSIPFVNWFNSLLATSDIQADHLQAPQFWVFLVFLLILTGLAAGAYPAYYISRFDPVRILRGREKAGGTNRKIRFLLVLQFSLAILAVYSAVVMLDNTRYTLNFDLGFNEKNVLVLPVSGRDRIELIMNRLQDDPDILKITSSAHLMNTSSMNKDIRIGETTARAQTMFVGADFFSTYGIDIINGSEFSEMGEEEALESIIVNEAFLQQFALTDDAVGTYGHILLPEPGEDVRIAGVMKNIYQNGLWEPLQPLMIRYGLKEHARYVSILFRDGAAAKVAEKTEHEFKSLFPYLPYNGFFYHEHLTAHTFEVTYALQKVFRSIALLTLVISALGFYALVSLNIARRSKEIGIRRVLGADLLNVAGLIFREFVFILLAASLIGTAAGFFLSNSLLDAIFAYHASASALPFLASLFLIFAVTALTVILKIYDVSRKDAALSLRYE